MVAVADRAVLGVPGHDPREHRPFHVHGLHHTYGDHIINVDAAVAEEWGRLNTRNPLPIIDGLLAASAKVRGWTLVTRNTADIARTGVRLVNPFDPVST